MKKIEIVLFLLVIPLAACSSEGGEKFGPAPSDVAALLKSVGGGGSAPAPPSQTTTLPPPSKLPAATPAPQQLPASAFAQAEIPQAVPPPDLISIQGVQEVYYESTSLACYQMEAKFKQQGLRLELVDVLPLNQSGRRGTPRAKSKRTPGRRDTSATYGRMFICFFRGIDAVVDRYAFNDDYVNSGLEPPINFDNQQHPNDYRNPEPTPTIAPGNPNRRTVPDPEPPDPNAPDPYKDLPF
jgi:hypothetical protein